METKLLTEAEWRSHYAALGASPGSIETAIAMLRERGLIAPEPVDPDLLEAREVCAKDAEITGSPIAAEHYRNGARDGSTMVVIALAALKRGKELDPKLTREMVVDCLTSANLMGRMGNRDIDDLWLLLHAALTKQLK